MTNPTKGETEAERSSGWFKVTQLAVAAKAWSCSPGRLLGSPWSLRSGVFSPAGSRAPLPRPQPPGHSTLHPTRTPILRPRPRPEPSPVTGLQNSSAGPGRALGLAEWGKQNWNFGLAAGRGGADPALTAASWAGPAAAVIHHPPSPQPGHRPAQGDQSRSSRRIPRCRGPRAQPGLAPEPAPPSAQDPPRLASSAGLCSLPYSAGAGPRPLDGGAQPIGARDQGPGPARPRGPGPWSRAPIVQPGPPRGAWGVASAARAPSQHVPLEGGQPLRGPWDSPGAMTWDDRAAGTHT